MLSNLSSSGSNLSPIEIIEKLFEEERGSVRIEIERELKQKYESEMMLIQRQCNEQNLKNQELQENRIRQLEQYITSMEMDVEAGVAARAAMSELEKKIGNISAEKSALNKSLSELRREVDKVKYESEREVEVIQKQLKSANDVMNTCKIMMEESRKNESELSFKLEQMELDRSRLEAQYKNQTNSLVEKVKLLESIYDAPDESTFATSPNLENRHGSVIIDSYSEHQQGDGSASKFSVDNNNSSALSTTLLNHTEGGGGAGGQEGSDMTAWTLSYISKLKTKLEKEQVLRNRSMRDFKSLEEERNKLLKQCEENNGRIKKLEGDLRDAHQV
jgi:myosin heavy subunit